MFRSSAPPSACARVFLTPSFPRTFAVRVKSFARSYGGAELNMHFSISQDMTPLQRFLDIVKDKGLHGITAELERGTV